MKRHSRPWLTVVALVVAVPVTAATDPFGTRAPSLDRPATAATCDQGGRATTRVVAGRDAVLGPLVLIGAHPNARHRPDAFDGHGYKIPVTLPRGTTATLSVPRELRSRVGLVFSSSTQDRVRSGGVRAADAAVRFEACPASGRPGRTG